jgi:hypothetical protein
LRFLPPTSLVKENPCAPCPFSLFGGASIPTAQASSQACDHASTCVRPAAISWCPPLLPQTCQGSPKPASPMVQPAACRQPRDSSTLGVGAHRVSISRGRGGPSEQDRTATASQNKADRKSSQPKKSQSIRRIFVASRGDALEDTTSGVLRHALSAAPLAGQLRRRRQAANGSLCRAGCGTELFSCHKRRQDRTRDARRRVGP